MSLFRILEDFDLKKVDRKDFSNEKELQNLVEKNLLYLMGIKLIESEYPVPNGRIDTLGIDEDGVPVIIEYKWKKDLSAIVQGLFYLNWVMQNRKPFESIVKDKLGKEDTVNWSVQPRLLIVAQDFDIKETSAIDLMHPNVELKKYALYEGFFDIESVNIVKTKPSSKINAEPLVSEQTVTLAQLLKKTSKELSEVFLSLRDKILEISDAVWEKVGPHYCDYRTSSTFASVNIQKSKLKIYIKMGPRKIDDPKNITKPVPTTYGFGFLNTQFEISKMEDIDYSTQLIMQAYDYLSS